MIPGGEVAGSSGCVSGERLVQGVGVPGYFYAEEDWERACAQDGVRLIVMNPADGPGRQASRHYVRRVQRARRRGIRVLGYVSTQGGSRSQTDVLQDVERYRCWYGVSDVFLDEAGTTTDAFDWHRQVTDHIRSAPGAVVVLNPGVVPDESYLSIGDIVVAFEGGVEGYLSVTVPPWCGSYPPNRFWHLVHSTPARCLPAVLVKSRELAAGTVYVTDDVGPNLWGHLPPYWEREVSCILAGNTGLGSTGSSDSRNF